MIVSFIRFVKDLIEIVTLKKVYIYGNRYYVWKRENMLNKIAKIIQNKLLRYFQKELENIIQKIDTLTNDIKIIDNVIQDLSRDKPEYRKFKDYEDYLHAEADEFLYFKNEKELKERDLIELKNKRTEIEKLFNLYNWEKTENA